MLSVSLLGGLGFDPTSVPATTTTATPNAQQPQCSADGKFIWVTATSTVAGHWERLIAGQECVPGAGSGGGPAVRDQRGGQGGGGGVTVTEMQSLRTILATRTALVAERNKRDIQQLLALAPSLPACPTSSIASNGECYDRSPIPSLSSMLLAPGSFDVFGVPFHVSELKDGKFFQGPFVPDTESRFLMDAAILEASQRKFASYDKVGFTVKAALQNNPDLQISVPGFSLNPVAPLDGELYSAWRARGGYPISLAILRGQEKINETGIGIPFCASISCACPRDDAKMGQSWRDGGLIPADQQINLWPRCIGGTLAKDGVNSTGQNAVSWNVFVAQDATNPSQYYLALVAVDPAWYTKAAEWLGSQFEKLAGIFCVAAPAVQQQVSSTTAEKCFDKAQKKCAKGTPGCTCVKPPAVAQVSTNAFNMWMSSWCSSWTEEHTQPVYEPPTPKVPEDFTKRSLPWGWIAAGSVAFVGVAALILSPPKKRAA